jgi:hypothetical protein
MAHNLNANAFAQFLRAAAAALETPASADVGAPRQPPRRQRRRSSTKKDWTAYIDQYDGGLSLPQWLLSQGMVVADRRAFTAFLQQLKSYANSHNPEWNGYNNYLGGRSIPILVEQLPVNALELLRVPGIGDQAFLRYGILILICSNKVRQSLGEYCKFDPPSRFPYAFHLIWPSNLSILRSFDT